MDDELRITIVGVSGLPEETKLALQEVAERRGKELLDEAGRLEAEVNSGLGIPMITPSMINHADSWQRLGCIGRQRSKAGRNWLLVSGLATFVGGRHRMDHPAAPPRPADGGRVTGPRWLGADEVAVALGRPVPSVYRLAHKRQWRRYVHNGRTYYDPGDVAHTPR